MLGSPALSRNVASRWLFFDRVAAFSELQTRKSAQDTALLCALRGESSAV